MGGNGRSAPGEQSVGRSDRRRAPNARPGTPAKRRQHDRPVAGLGTGEAWKRQRNRTASKGAWACCSRCPYPSWGLSCFRSWIALLTSTSPLGGFAEPLHDCILTVSLLALAFFARKIVPLCERRWAYTVCAVAALMASLLVIASAAGVRPLAIEYAAMAFAAVASAFFILFWCELYSCLSIVKTAMSLALALLATEALKFLLEGFVPAYRLGALLVLPVLTLLLLARAYAHVPADSRPRVTSGKTHIPLERSSACSPSTTSHKACAWG